MGVDPLTIGIGLSAVGAVTQGVGSFMGMQAQQRESQARQRMFDYQSQQQRLDQVRQSRIASAKVLQAGANQGASESSSVKAGAMEAYGQAESNMNQISTEQGIGDTIFSAKQAQMQAEGISGLGSGLGNIGAFAAGNSDAIKTVFG